MNQKLQIEYLPTDQLQMYDGNANIHSAHQIDQIAESIEEFDFSSPILAWHNENGEAVIVAGHGRLMAARKLGIDELPVVFLDHMTDEQRRAFTLVENQLTRLSEFDSQILANELDSIFDIDMAEFGLEKEIADVMEQIDDYYDDNKSGLATELDERKDYIVIRIDNDIDWAQAQTLFGLQKKSRWMTNSNGTGGGDERLCRVVTWEQFSSLFLGDEYA